MVKTDIDLLFVSVYNHIIIIKWNKGVTRTYKIGLMIKGVKLLRIKESYNNEVKDLLLPAA